MTDTEFIEFMSRLTAIGEMTHDAVDEQLLARYRSASDAGRENLIEALLEHHKRAERIASVILDMKSTDPSETYRGTCFHHNSDGTKTEFTLEKYAREPVGRIFIRIGGFKPPAGKSYKPDTKKK